MLFFRWVLFIFIFSSGFFQVHAEARPLALIYRGLGVCEGCAEAVGRLLKAHDWDLKYIGPGELTSSNFAKAQLYVQPGGDDNVEQTILALSKQEKNNLRSFVKKGGTYLGLCAGAYLAGTFADDEESLPAFGLVSAEAQQEISESGPMVIPIFYKNTQRWVYYQSGPTFDEKSLNKAKVIARYAGSGHPAALITQFGQGRVGLVGPHWEASSDWYEDEKISDRDGLDHHLFYDFLYELLLTGQQN